MIDTDAIRCKVLELAMRGNLSTGLIGDSNLVDRYKNIAIRDENEIPYAIPTTWIWVRVKDVIKKDVGGGTPSKSIEEYWENGDIPWASVKDFSSAEGGYLKDTIDHITQEGLDNSSANMVDEDAIVICMRMALGKIVRVAKPMAINQDLRAVWLNELADKDYFVYFYSTLKVEGRGMTVAGIRKDELMNYLFPLPSIEEQKRIVKRINSIFDILDTIDEIQDSYFSNIEILKDKLIDAGIQGKLTEQLPEDGTAEELYAEIQEEKTKIIASGILKGRKNKKINSVDNSDGLFAVPNNWKWIRLGEICEVFGRIGFRGYTKADIVEPHEGAITISPSNIDDDGNMHFEECTYLSWFKYEESPEIQIENEDIIIVKTGSSYGKAGIVKNLPEKATINPQLAVLKYVFCNKDYLNYVLNCSSSKKQYEQFVIGAAIPTFSQEKLANLLIPLPPLSEQERIVGRIEEILSII